MHQGKRPDHVRQVHNPNCFAPKEPLHREKSVDWDAYGHEPVLPALKLQVDNNIAGTVESPGSPQHVGIPPDQRLPDEFRVDLLQRGEVDDGRTLGSMGAHQSLDRHGVGEDPLESGVLLDRSLQFVGGRRAIAS